MWRRVYLTLVLVRLYFALSSSYLHPDENFQGPEVIAGQIFGYPVRLTWEFTSDNPIRSVFPLWPIYGLPMLLLRSLISGNGHNGEVSPVVVFWTLRVLMFTLSFVLEDWAIHELITSKRHRVVAMVLVASSYVTWTYQTHTFSNSIETLVVLWSLVLIKRIVKAKNRAAGSAPAFLAMFIVFGVFNRITFPAFLLIPGLRLIPHFVNRPFALMQMIIFGLLTACLAIYLDTTFYAAGPLTWKQLFTNPIITPLNNLLYNLHTSNLANHGLHPWYQHLFINLPQLLGPAFVLFMIQPHLSLRLYSALSGIFVLSLFQHQEARFLLPTVPLILSSLKLPKHPKYLKIWMGVWVGFNLIFGVLMGTFHQGGIVPTQLFLGEQPNATMVLWWKTYSPPVWLLDGKSEELTTYDLMGMGEESMLNELSLATNCHPASTAQSVAADAATGASGTYLVAPNSATFLDQYVAQRDNMTTNSRLQFEEVWRYNRHLNLDDLDFGGDGFWNTIKRVVGRRGLVTWRVTKDCSY